MSAKGPEPTAFLMSLHGSNQRIKGGESRRQPSSTKKMLFRCSEEVELNLLIRSGKR
jgi:hypothetical protein